MEVKILYRYEGGPIQGFGALQYKDLKLMKYKVIKETSKGFWIINPNGLFNEYRTKRWVNKDGKRSFAHTTKELALESFRRRINIRIGFLKRDLDIAHGLKSQAEIYYNNGSKRT